MSATVRFPRRVTLFSPTGEQLLSEVYDPESELWQDVLLRIGSPEVVNMVRQSDACKHDGEAWLWSHEHRAEVCQGYIARIEDAREQSSSPTKERNTTMPKKPKEETETPDTADAKPKRGRPRSPKELAQAIVDIVTSKPPRMKVENVTRELKVALSPEEVAERADRAAKLLEDRDHEEANLKAYASSVKSRIATMEAEMRELSGEVRNKFTYRDVQLERQYLYDTGVVREVRLDSGEVVSERVMTERERQADLPFPSSNTQDAVAAE